MLVHAYLMLALACNLMRNPAPSCFHYHICNAAAAVTAVTAVVAILTCNMQHASCNRKCCNVLQKFCVTFYCFLALFRPQCRSAKSGTNHRKCNLSTLTICGQTYRYTFVHAHRLIVLHLSLCNLVCCFTSSATFAFVFPFVALNHIKSFSGFWFYFFFVLCAGNYSRVTFSCDPVDLATIVALVDYCQFCV